MREKKSEVRCRKESLHYSGTSAEGATPAFSIRISDFDLLSDFGLRTSDFFSRIMRFSPHHSHINPLQILPLLERGRMVRRVAGREQLLEPAA